MSSSNYRIIVSLILQSSIFNKGRRELNLRTKNLGSFMMERMRSTGGPQTAAVKEKYLVAQNVQSNVCHSYSPIDVTAVNRRTVCNVDVFISASLAHLPRAA